MRALCTIAFRFKVSSISRLQIWPQLALALAGQASAGRAKLPLVLRVPHSGDPGRPRLNVHRPILRVCFHSTPLALPPPESLAVWIPVLPLELLRVPMPPLRRRLGLGLGVAVKSHRATVTTVPSAVALTLPLPLPLQMIGVQIGTKSIPSSGC
jgi:hypothetical protein